MQNCAMFLTNVKQEDKTFRNQAYLKTVWLADNCIMAGMAEGDIGKRSNSMHSAIVIVALSNLKKLQP
jgi:hypothetical protein